MKNLFTPISMGSLDLPNRIFMAPLTRTRAGMEHIPNALMAKYYAQRASAGLIIAEATMVAKNHSAFVAEPGIYEQNQIDGWRLVTDAVHANGGKIFLQIWHGGRAAHPDINQGQQPIAPSAIAIKGSEIHTPAGKKPYVTPHALTIDEIPAVIQSFQIAAENAKNAGFDGVELHGANGYLIDQFLRSSTNQREDHYGGSLENRTRFLRECLEAVIAVWGENRVGLRLSPLNSYNDISDQNPVELTSYVAKMLNQYPLAYLHMVRGDFAGIQTGDVMTVAREQFNGILIGNMGYSAQEANEAIEKSLVDAVAFGLPFIANPDLVNRFKLNHPLQTARPSNFYAGEEKGYTDYPTIDG